jgi:hypothetical protein
VRILAPTAGYLPPATDVRYGSNSEVDLADADFRFTPQSRRPPGGRACPKGHQAAAFRLCLSRGSGSGRGLKSFRHAISGKLEPAESKYLTVVVANRLKQRNLNWSVVLCVDESGDRYAKSNLTAFFVGKMAFNRSDVADSNSPRLPMVPATARLREINSKSANLTLSVVVRPRVPLKEEAARQKERERREQAVDEAQAALDKAEQEHAKRAAVIQAELKSIVKRSQAEEARWERERGRLEKALRRARD